MRRELDRAGVTAALGEDAYYASVSDVLKAYGERMSSTNGGSTPARAGIVLGSLIAVAAVANLGLAVANVALPVDRRCLRLVADRR